MLIFCGLALPCPPNFHVAVSTQPNQQPSLEIRQKQMTTENTAAVVRLFNRLPAKPPGNAYLPTCLHHHPSMIRFPFMHYCLLSTHVQRACPWHRARPSAIAHAEHAEHGPPLCQSRDKKEQRCKSCFFSSCSDSNEPFHCADQPMFRLQKRSCMLFP